jgi:hypothetical protein
MSSMEPEVREFLKKIVQSIFLGLFWLLINMTLGIYFELLFVDGRLRLSNIIFYLFFIGSLVLLIRFYIKTWKDRFPHG